MAEICLEFSNSVCSNPSEMCFCGSRGTSMGEAKYATMFKQESKTKKLASGILMAQKRQQKTLKQVQQKQTKKTQKQTKQHIDVKNQKLNENHS